MKNIQYLIFLAMTLGLGQLHGASEPSKDNETILNLRDDHSIEIDPSTEIDQSTENGQIQFVTQTITSLLNIYAKSNNKSIIKEITFTSSLDVKDHTTGVSTASKNNSGIFEYNEHSTSRVNFKQDVTSIVNCFQHYKSTDKLYPAQEDSPSLHLESIKIVSERDIPHTNNNNILDKIRHYTDWCVEEETKTLYLFNNKVGIKKQRYHKSYLTKRNVTLLAFITCSTAAAATMYYTKKSPKDLVPKLWSLASATRRMFSKK